MFKRFRLLLAWGLILEGCSMPRPAQLVIAEHLLSGAPDISTDQLVFHFAQGNQEAMLAKTASYRDFRTQYKEYNRQILAPFGYSLTDDKSESGASGYFSIYRGNQLIAKDVMYMAPVSLNASQTDFIGLPSFSDGAHLFTRSKFELDQFWVATKIPFAYVGDRILYLEIWEVSPGVSRLQAYLDNQRVFDDQFNNVSTYSAFDGPWAYGDHWALDILDAKPDGQQGWNPYDRLIQDGQDVNILKGYQNSFQFAVLTGRPFYFFQKDGKIGISFDGQEIPRGYDEIPHYGCCTPSLLNPGLSMNMVWFFARRGEAWYYVEAYVSGH